MRARRFGHATPFAPLWNGRSLGATLILILGLISCESNPVERPCPDNGTVVFWSFSPTDSLKFSVVPDDQPLDTVHYFYRVDTFHSPTRVFLQGWGQPAAGGNAVPHSGWVELTNAQPYCRALRWNINAEARPSGTSRVYQYLGWQTPAYSIYNNLKVQRLPR